MLILQSNFSLKVCAWQSVELNFTESAEVLNGAETGELLVKMVPPSLGDKGHLSPG